MKRKSAAAISIVVAASSAADAFLVPPSVVGASRNLFPPKTKILPNPNHRIQHLSDHMPCRPKNVQNVLHVAHMQGDGSTDDITRREMMDIALGAMTGWMLGPRVTFAASSLSDPDEDDETWSHSWDEKYTIFAKYYRENGNGYARIAEKHRVDAAELTAWVAKVR